MCEAEQWEGALVELKRQSYVPFVRRNATAWKAQIFIGMERYRDVLAMKEEARRSACNIDPFLAVANARLGNIDKALRAASDALRSKQPDAKMALGHVYFAAQDFDRALVWFEAAAQNRIQRAGAMRAAGVTLIALGDYREARKAFEQAIRSGPFARREDLIHLAECCRQCHQEGFAAEIEQLAEEKG